jgi:hypothetical protein
MRRHLDAAVTIAKRKKYNFKRFSRHLVKLQIVENE